MTVQQTGPLPTEPGVLVADIRSSEQAGLGSPPPVRDQPLIASSPVPYEHILEHIPLRTVHAHRSGVRVVPIPTSRRSPPGRAVA